MKKNSYILELSELSSLHQIGDCTTFSLDPQPPAASGRWRASSEQDGRPVPLVQFWSWFRSVQCIIFLCCTVSSVLSLLPVLVLPSTSQSAQETSIRRIKAGDFDSGYARHLCAVVHVGHYVPVSLRPRFLWSHQRWVP